MLFVSIGNWRPSIEIRHLSFRCFKKEAAYPFLEKSSKNLIQKPQSWMLTMSGQSKGRELGSRSVLEEEENYNGEVFPLSDRSTAKSTRDSRSPLVKLCLYTRAVVHKLVHIKGTRTSGKEEVRPRKNGSHSRKKGGRNFGRLTFTRTRCSSPSWRAKQRTHTRGRRHRHVSAFLRIVPEETRYNRWIKTTKCSSFPTAAIYARNTRAAPRFSCHDRLFNATFRIVLLLRAADSEVCQRAGAC